MSEVIREELKNFYKDIIVKYDSLIEKMREYAKLKYTIDDTDIKRISDAKTNLQLSDDGYITATFIIDSLLNWRMVVTVSLDEFLDYLDSWKL